VKRLRPIELGPFDYEDPPKTSSLWVSEGLTSYYGDLIVARAGLGARDHFLSSLSSHIGQFQRTPGRLVQTLEQSSLDVWSGGTSGVGYSASYSSGQGQAMFLPIRPRYAFAFATEEPRGFLLVIGPQPWLSTGPQGWLPA